MRASLGYNVKCFFFFLSFPTCCPGPCAPPSLYAVPSTSSNRRKRNVGDSFDIYIDVYWIEPLSGANYDFYVLSWHPSTQATVQLPNTEYTYRITGLSPDTTYDIELYTTKRLSNDEVVRSEPVTITVRTSEYYIFLL